MPLVRINPSSPTPSDREILAKMPTKVGEFRTVKTVRRIKLTRDRVRKIVTARVVPTFGGRA
jgi:hypothetical protein